MRSACQNIFINFVIFAAVFYVTQANNNETEFPSLKSSTCSFNLTTNFVQCNSYLLDLNIHAILTNLQKIKLKINSSLGSESCEVVPESLPFNFTLYAIGELKATGGDNPLTWFRLYPRKEDNSGWWYYKHIKHEDMKMSIHSKDKHSRNDAGFIVIDPICWGKMSVLIRSSKTIESIEAEKYNKGIFSKPYQKVKVIGTLDVVN